MDDTVVTIKTPAFTYQLSQEQAAPIGLVQHLLSLSHDEAGLELDAKQIGLAMTYATEQRLPAELTHEQIIGLQETALYLDYDDLYGVAMRWLADYINEHSPEELRETELRLQLQGLTLLGFNAPQYTMKTLEQGSTPMAFKRTSYDIYECLTLQLIAKLSLVLNCPTAQTLVFDEAGQVVDLPPGCMGYLAHRDGYYLTVDYKGQLLKDGQEVVRTGVKRIVTMTDDPVKRYSLLLNNGHYVGLTDRVMVDYEDGVQADNTYMIRKDGQVETGHSYSLYSSNLDKSYRVFCNGAYGAVLTLDNVLTCFDREDDSSSKLHRFFEQQLDFMPLDVAIRFSNSYQPVCYALSIKGELFYVGETGVVKLDGLYRELAHHGSKIYTRDFQGQLHEL